MIRKIAIVLTFLSIFFVVACGKNASVEQPNGEDNSVGENYAVLEEAVSAFNTLDSGTLQIKIDFEQNYMDASEPGGNVYQSVDTNTISFVKAGENYNFIEMAELQEQSVPTGSKQENGVYTMYNYEAYDDGTFQWKEGAAELGYYDLPEEVTVFTELVDLSLVEGILLEKEGEYVKYSLTLDEAFFDYAAQDSEFNSYELKEYDINYFVDPNNLLSRVSLTKNEFWIQSENYNVTQTTVYDISLVEKNQKVDLNYFRNSGTYKKPVYGDITEIWKEDFINIPETYILDVRVPKLKENLPNAEKINQKIAMDCSIALNATVDDLVSEGEWGNYPWHTVDFAVYKFGDIYQICIFNTEASAWGSGIGMWMYKYYYDINLGDVVSQEDFLVHMNYIPEEILEIFYQDYLGEFGTGESYTYDEIADWYYFDENANIQFYVNLFG